MSLNQILLIGNAGREPELRYMEDGTPVTGFSLAVNANRQNKSGDWVEDTEWFNVSVWGRQAESVNQNLTKGRKIFVDGRLTTSEYTSATGEVRQSLDVRAFRVIVVDRRDSNFEESQNNDEWSREGEATASSTESLKSTDAESDDTVEELPW